MRISDWSSDVCSSDLLMIRPFAPGELSNHRTPEWPILLTHSNMSRWSDLTSCTSHDFYRSRRAIDPLLALRQDRKSDVSGKSVSVRVVLGGRRIIKNTTHKRSQAIQNKVGSKA